MQSFGYDWLDRLTSAATNAAGIGQYSHTYAYNAIGNITSYNGNAYTYGAKPHAVTAAFGNAYGYDAVGNQTSRTVGGIAYTQTFDYDNRLTGVAGGSVSATFLYDAEGNRVKGTIGGVTTVYLAGLYEYQNGAVTKYYEGGAMRRTGYATDNGVFYVVSDHLRSTSVLVNRDGTVKSRNFYYPYGGNRGGSAFSGITTKRFTGQYHEQGLPGGEGLSYYNARWYDAQVGMFISADTLVPSPLAPQTFNRYAYTRGNPLRYNDPTGHDVGCPGRDAGACGGGAPGYVGYSGYFGYPIAYPPSPSPVYTPRTPVAVTRTYIPFIWGPTRPQAIATPVYRTSPVARAIPTAPPQAQSTPKPASPAQPLVSVAALQNAATRLGIGSGSIGFGRACLDYWVGAVCASSEARFNVTGESPILTGYPDKWSFGPASVSSTGVLSIPVARTFNTGDAAGTIETRAAIFASPERYGWGMSSVSKVAVMSDQMTVNVVTQAGFTHETRPLRALGAAVAVWTMGQAASFARTGNVQPASGQIVP